MDDSSKPDVEGLVARLAVQHGWSDAIREHALLAHGTDYGEECVIQAAGAVEIRCPQYPADCDYVRVCQSGFEIGYWTSQEWRESPEEVVGAMLGAAARGGAGPALVGDWSAQRSGPGEGASPARDIESRSNGFSESIKSVRQRGFIRTFLLATNDRTEREMLAVEVPLEAMTDAQIRDGDHHDVAISRARALGRGLGDFIAFDEMSPAAAQMQQLVRTSASARPARVLVQVEGGLVQALSADAPVSVLILDADVEGLHEDVHHLDAVGEAVYVRLEEIDVVEAEQTAPFVGEVFAQALQAIQARALQEESSGNDRASRDGQGPAA